MAIATSRTSMLLLCHLSDLGGRRANPRLDAAKLLEDLFARRLLSHGLPKLAVVQDKGQPGEQLQMTSVRRTDDGEQDVNGLSIQGPEIDRLRKESERHRRPRDVQDDG